MSIEDPAGKVGRVSLLDRQLPRQDGVELGAELVSGWLGASLPPAPGLADHQDCQPPPVTSHTRADLSELREVREVRCERCEPPDLLSDTGGDSQWWPSVWASARPEAGPVPGYFNGTISSWATAHSPAYSQHRSSSQVKSEDGISLV